MEHPLRRIIDNGKINSHRILSCSILFLVIGVFTSCSELNLIGNEHSVEGIEYNDIFYTGDNFYYADSDLKKLGKADNGATVYAIGASDSPEYILIVGRDNSSCFIASDSFVPVSGTVTKALVDPSIRGDNSKQLCTEEELDILEELSKVSGDPQQFTIDNYFTDGNAFYYVYNNSGVSCEENYGGYVAYTDGKWIFASPEIGEYEWGEVNSVKVTGIVIEDEALIEKMCKTDLTKHIEY